MPGVSTAIVGRSPRRGESDTSRSNSLFGYASIGWMSRSRNSSAKTRLVTKRVFAELFRDLDIQPIDAYPNKLFDLLVSLSPRRGERPTIAVLTPGIYNSAYFEHAFLAQQMGVELT